MSRPLNLLLVEDSDEDALLVLRELKKAGFVVKHHRVENRDAMKDVLENQAVDLVISDYCLPHFSAPEALALFKESGLDVPFLIVSGTIGEETAVSAMRAGAHDFLVKGQYSRLIPAIDRELGEAEVRRARRQAEQAVHTKERRFRSLIENAQDVITVLNAESEITYISPSIQRVLGYSVEELMQLNIWDVVHPSDGQALKQSFARILQQHGNVSQIELRLRHRNGHYRVLESIGRNMLGDSRVPGIVVNSRDITERKEAEERLRQSNRKLEAALLELSQTQQQVVQQERLRALGEMASGVAHDFNNALASVLGFTEAMLMYPEVLDDREQTLEFIQMMNTAAKDGANVVNRLSEFYRQREATETLVPIDLNRLIEGTILLTAPRWKAQAQSKGVKIEISTELGEIPEIPLAEAELRQAFTNLIFNAVDAMPEGGTLSMVTSLGEDCVKLVIRDQGTGMSEDTLQRCLEPFFTTKGQKGTGLGLAMVYGVIQRHGGTMKIQSQLGEGTVFHITLPLQQQQIESSTSLSSSQAGICQGLKVLIVEPEPLVRKMLGDFLKLDQHQVTSVETGQAALELLDQNFDLLIADKALGDMSGLQLASTAKTPQLKVVLLTGFGDEGETGNLPEGVDRVLKKPFTLAEFRLALFEASQS
jgi:PAS domain S-box-containing protein